MSIQLLTLLSGLEEMLSGELNGRGKLILDACDAAVKKSQELAKRIPKGKAFERVERALQQVTNSSRDDALNTGPVYIYRGFFTH